jgi:hypothetical protein
LDNLRFGCKQREYTSPLEKGNHPELDTSEELDTEGINKYQTMIGSLQWAISLGRFDIQTATMTMSRLMEAPRQGYLDRSKQMYGYHRRYASAAIHVRVKEPDFSELPDHELDWCEKYMGRLKNCYQWMHQTLLEKQQQQFITQM